MGRVTVENVHEAMRYHPPETEARKIAHGAVNAAAEEFVRVLLEYMPECADGTTAIRRVREARMYANSAIALNGMI
jgi:hypothetical protein